MKTAETNFAETWSLQSILIRYRNTIITISLQYFDKKNQEIIQKKKHANLTKDTKKKRYENFQT